MTLDEIERQTILQALDRYKGNLSQVATALGISRAALYRRLEKYNINNVIDLGTCLIILRLTVTTDNVRIKGFFLHTSLSAAGIR